MELIVVRHGLTQANLDGVVNGQLDEPLIEDGKQQAQKLAQRLESKGINAIYSSPLQRAISTALPIAKKIDKLVNVDQRLIEVGLGSFQGKSNAVVKKELGFTARELLDHYKYDFVPFGGESSGQVERRVSSFIDDLKNQPYKKVLIVTHGGIVRWLYYICTGKKITVQPNSEELTLKI